MYLLKLQSIITCKGILTSCFCILAVVSFDLLLNLFPIMKTKLPLKPRNNIVYRMSGTNLDKPRNNRNQSTDSTHDLLQKIRQRYNTTVDFKYPLLTLFTTWKTNSEKFKCRNNTINNWSSFAPYIKTVLFTDEPDLTYILQKRGWEVLTPKLSSIGVPILKYMFLTVMEKYNTKYYAYANSDILFTGDLIKTLRFLAHEKMSHSKPLLIVGQRTDAKNVTHIQASSFDNILKVSETGEIHSEWGLDYFITNSIYPWYDCPEVVIGRMYYDNFILLNARKHNFTTIDATKTILALHQLTKAGNYEGHHHPDGKYNDVLLKKIFKNIHYGAGRISCATYYTKYKPSNEIRITKRTLSNTC